ncbi:MAG: TetR/AcrR family transcriptional regulator, partial [Stackebrandtia sp.]
PLRADARRNRERIVAAARELFARHGREAQMEDIAARSGLGMGTVYRHFPSKQALLTAMVRERFQEMAVVAQEAEAVADPGEAFEVMLRRYLEAAEDDAGFQLALMGSDELPWADIKPQKAEFTAAATRIIDRAVTAGALRDDFTIADFPIIAHGIIATMYFKPAGTTGWRRHLELVLDGIRGASFQ